MSKKIKAIEFRGIISGYGVVNFDADTQKKVYFSLPGLKDLLPRTSTGEFPKCVTFAKKNFYVDENRNPFYKLKISGNCLREHIFGPTPKFGVGVDDTIRCIYTTSFHSLCGGHMFTIKKEDKENDKDDKMDINRKSPLRISDAEQMSVAETDDAGNVASNYSAKSYFEFFSRKGVKDDTSAFWVETCGDIDYGFRGLIDIDLLEFISCTPVKGEFSIDERWVDNGSFDMAMKYHYGEELGGDYTNGYFLRAADRDAVTGAYCEHGILLGDKIIAHLCKELLKNIRNIKIHGKGGSYASVDKLEYRIIYDDITDNSSKIVTVSDDSDIDSIEFGEFYKFYEEASDEDITRSNEIFRAFSEKVVLDNARKKDKKAAGAAERKARLEEKREENLSLF